MNEAQLAEAPRKDLIKYVKDQREKGVKKYQKIVADQRAQKGLVVASAAGTRAAMTLLVKYFPSLADKQDMLGAIAAAGGLYGGFKAKDPGMASFLMGVGIAGSTVLADMVGNLLAEKLAPDEDEE